MIAVYYLALVVAMLLAMSAWLYLCVYLMEWRDAKREQQAQRIDACPREDVASVRHEEGPRR